MPQPFQSHAAVAFWHKLAAKKLHEFRLSEDLRVRLCYASLGSLPGM